MIYLLVDWKALVLTGAFFFLPVHAFLCHFIPLSTFNYLIRKSLKNQFVKFDFQKFNNVKF